MAYTSLMKTTEAAKHNPARAAQILAGARIVFIEHGYYGASVDDIAAQAQVSKATLYRYYPDKQQMFQAYIAVECQKQANQTFTFATDTMTIEEILRATAKKFVAFLCSDFAIDIFRVICAEVRHFPDLGRDFYESGPLNAKTRLSILFCDAVAKEELIIKDTSIAAEQFAELCKADLHLQRVLGLKKEVTREEIDYVANKAVDVFLKAYSPTNSK